jgi:hypothetical protein
MIVHPLSWLGSFFSRAQAPAPFSLFTLFSFPHFSAQSPSPSAVERAAAHKRETAAPLWRSALAAVVAGSPEALDQLLSAPGAALWLATPKAEQASGTAPPAELATAPRGSAMAVAAPASFAAAAGADTDERSAAAEIPLGLLVAQAICAVREGEAGPETEGVTVSALAASGEPTTTTSADLALGGGHPGGSSSALSIDADFGEGRGEGREGHGDAQGGRSWAPPHASLLKSEFIGEIVGGFGGEKTGRAVDLALTAEPDATQSFEADTAAAPAFPPSASAPPFALPAVSEASGSMNLPLAVEPVLPPETLIRLARALETPIETAQPDASPERVERDGLAPVFHEAAALALWARVSAARRLGDFSGVSARFAAPALLAHESVQAASDGGDLAKPLSAGFGGDPWRVMAFCALRAPRALRRMIDLLRDADLERPAVGRAAPAPVIAWDRLTLALLLQCASGEERKKDADAAWRSVVNLDLAAPLRVASQALTALLTPPPSLKAGSFWKFDMGALRRARSRVRDLERCAGAALRHHDERWFAVCEGHEFGALFSARDLPEAPQEERIGAPKAATATARSPSAPTAPSSSPSSSSSSSQPAVVAASVLAAAKARHAARRL